MSQRVTCRAQVDRFLWGNSVAGHGKTFANQKNSFAKVGETLTDHRNGVAGGRIGFAQISQAYAG